MKKVTEYERQLAKRVFQNSLQSPDLFQIVFVINDEEDSMEVFESPLIDFHQVIEHLGKGDSVFITPKFRDSPNH